MKLELTIPTNLNEINLKQYQEFVSIEEPNNIDVISTFCNVSKEYANKIPLKDISSIAGAILEVLNTNKKPFIQRFKMGGKPFGFIPNLNEISYGENADIVANINDIQTIHKAMSVLYRPITVSIKDKYIIEDYEGTAKYSEVMLDMPLGVCLGAVVFFCNLTNDLLKAIPNYLEKEMEQQTILVKSGVDIQKYTALLKEILDDLMRLQNLNYTLA